MWRARSVHALTSVARRTAPPRMDRSITDQSCLRALGPLPECDAVRNVCSGDASLTQRGSDAMSQLSRTRAVGTIFLCLLMALVAGPVPRLPVVTPSVVGPASATVGGFGRCTRRRWHLPRCPGCRRHGRHERLDPGERSRRRRAAPLRARCPCCLARRRGPGPPWARTAPATGRSPTPSSPSRSPAPTSTWAVTSRTPRASRRPTRSPGGTAARGPPWARTAPATGRSQLRGLRPCRLRQRPLRGRRLHQCRRHREADYIAKWNGSAWSALGSNGSGDGALNTDVDALAVSGSDLYVGGDFTDAAGIA